MRRTPRVFILAAIFLLLIGYQNFSSVSPQEWDSTSSLKIINEMNTFQKQNQQPQALATPQSGTDLRSVSNDWMQRQGSLLLNGYDKKLEAAMNEKLNSWVQEITPSEAATTESSPEEAASAPSTTKENKSTPSMRKTKQNLRFARVNSLKYDLGENTCMNLTADPGNTRFNISQTLSRKASFGVEHRTADSQTQMFLKYEW